ncbi:ABC transporter permease [Halosimplex amylolyticum]|uniref:ABC transporter permease n=1 Tax=Halosimplex amylolyticum TaxID=3396616 RepID=UPI003F56C629
MNTGASTSGGDPVAGGDGTPPTARRARRDRLLTGVVAHVREFLREPVHVVLLLALPPLVVEGYGRAMASFPELPYLSAVPATLGRVNGAVFAAAFLAGLIGLFQVVSAVQADGRLAVCGFERADLFVSRLGTVLAVSVASAGVTFAALSWRVSVAAPAAAFGALVLAALTYGLLGVLVGTLVPRELEGSLVLVFVADFDDFLASGIVDVDSPVVNLLPLHYPHALFRAAVLDGSVPTEDALAGLAYLAVLFGVVLAAYVRLASGGERA